MYRKEKDQYYLKQGFPNCGMQKVVRWYAIKFIKILNLRVKRKTLLTEGEVQGAKK